MSILFPKAMNAFPTVAAVGSVAVLTTVVGAFWYYATPNFWEVGYMPTQPGGGFNHQIHVGKLGMDCRYCHTHVEESSEANIPNVATCYGCHAENRLAKFQDAAHKQKTDFIRTAYGSDQSIEWRRVHKLPDYVRNFPHNVHLNAGVSCYSCHGMIAGMPVVYQAHSLSMGWCLDCHRNPEPNLVPRDQVTNLQWVAAELERRATNQSPQVNARDLVNSLTQAPPENCGACHY